MPVRHSRAFSEDLASKVPHRCPWHRLKVRIAPSWVAFMSASCHPTRVNYWREAWSSPWVVSVCIVWAGAVERRHGAQLRRIDGGFHGALAERQVRGASARDSPRSHAMPLYNGTRPGLQVALTIRKRPRCAAAPGLRRNWLRATQLTTFTRCFHRLWAGLFVRTQEIGAVKVLADGQSTQRWWAWRRWARQRAQALAVCVLGVVVTGNAADRASCERGQQGRVSDNGKSSENCKTPPCENHKHGCPEPVSSRGVPTPAPLGGLQWLCCLKGCPVPSVVRFQSRVLRGMGLVIIPWPPAEVTRHANNENTHTSRYAIAPALAVADWRLSGSRSRASSCIASWTDRARAWSGCYVPRRVIGSSARDSPARARRARAPRRRPDRPRACADGAAAMVQSSSGVY